MRTIETNFIAAAAVAISLAAAIVTVYHVLWAIGLILRHRSTDRARLVIARGVLAALGFMVAATLMNTIALQSWVQIRMFAFVLLLRTLLKQVFEREQSTIARRVAGG